MMKPSEKKARSNRTNALKSTGPKTPAGRAIVSKNAVKHGLCARYIVIEGESATEFFDFKDSIAGQFAPVGVLEALLTDRIVASFWRLRRLGRIEVELLDHLCRSDSDHDTQGTLPISLKFPVSCDLNSSKPGGKLDKDTLIKAFHSAGQSLQDSIDDPACIDPSPQNISAMTGYLKYLQNLDLSPQDRDLLSKALEELTAMQASSDSARTLGSALAVDFKGPCVTTKFNRYESHIERSLFRNLHELQRLQAKRLGSDVAAPVAVDVDISACA